MYVLKVMPRFAETDALGHINNVTLPLWMEQAREPIFRLFTPDLDIKKWRLILARFEVDFLAEIFYGKEVEIRTYLGKLGRSSMYVVHEVWQDSKLCAKGVAVMIHFNHGSKRSEALPDSIRQQLAAHLIELP